ncbi:sugar porter family MFS transporter [Chitinophaga eiseniae]|uniref:Sugar porter family MFS transporter n=1 Tax=Chitinophaga eiseniae TaxID=634771 RepID=A0A847ST84_9BACT|nr:sugar porter family MFS transporter [Chitinophaga eiseniae]NLR82955.1 sugar porter family MFS transporter [Chitinophaga eiseniae]
MPVTVTTANLPGTELVAAGVNQRYVWLFTGVAALGGLLFGFDTAVISGAIPYISTYFSLDEYSLGWAVGSILIGCAAGSLLAGGAADRYGRRLVLLVCALLFAASGIGAGLSQQLYWFVFFRLLGGLGVGAAALVSPMYIAEMAPARLRGRLVAFYQMAIASGILLAYCSNLLLDHTGENNWRWMFASQAIPSVLFLVLLLLVPETPRWLIRSGRNREAGKILEKIYGEAPSDAEIIGIQNSYQQEHRSFVKELFNTKYRAVLWLGILVAVFQQITGINAILYYAPVIFRETGISGSSSLMQTIGVGIVTVLATLFAIGFVDKLGRKAFFLTGSLTMAVSLLAVGACFQLSYFDHYIVLIFMLLYVASFGCTLGAVTWVYLSEIFPNRVRGLAMSVATLALWLADFAVTYTFPVMARQLGTAVTMYCYAGISLIAFGYMLARVKETKGKSLEEIETLFLPSK